MTSKITIINFCDYLRTCSNAKYKGNNDKKMIDKIIRNVRKLADSTNLLVKEGECWLPADVEDEFFLTLLGEFDNETKILRYVSLSALNRLIVSNTQSMLSVVSMNDRSEVDYTEDYFKNILKENPTKSLTIDAPIDTFILSCAKGDSDDLTMWRLYGEDTKGACLIYTIDKEIINNGDFHLAPILYAGKDGIHKELRLIYDMMTRGVKVSPKKTKYKFIFNRWNLWKHFFKPYDYSVEKEVRLLYKPSKGSTEKKWILSNLNIFTPLIEFSCYRDEDKKEKLPLKIEKIILGPNFPERDINKAILTKFMKNMDSSIVIEESTIRNYRQ